MNNFYVYLWIDPKTNIERYVGKGSSRRVLDHWYTNTRLGYMLRKRKREGYDPQPIIIKSNLDEMTALALERVWIQIYGRLDLKKGTLFNLTDGGDGASGAIPYERTDEIKKLISEKNKGKTPHNKGKPSPIKGIPNPKKSHPAWNKGVPTPNKNKGKPSGKKGIPKPQPDVQCPYCEVQGRNQIMKRWHFDKCKNKQGTEVP